MKQLPPLSSEVPPARTITIALGNSYYEAVIGSGLLETIGARAAKLFQAKHCAVLADATTAALFADKIVGSLRAERIETALIIVRPGEVSKSLEQAGKICDQMQRAGLDRTSFVVALGGGVIGDLGGFAAAIYHRGIPCIQAPTTLLAQVDSAIGGKTGVNTSAGKNLLGVIHQPALVIADTDTLSTLPAREFQQGFAEVIKHAIIADPSLLDVAHVSNVPSKSPAKGKLALRDLVARNLEIKAAIVSRDEHDTSGDRAILNFGHTIGHAIERAAGYGELLHGEAISLGIVAACEISVRKAGLPESDRGKVLERLRELELPTILPPQIDRDKILAAVQADKKFARGQVRFVVTPRLGRARLTSDVELDDLRQAITIL